MDIVFYSIAILIFLLPVFFKGLHLLDIMPLFLFYFDATDVFIGHAPTYQYFECALILIFTLYVIYYENKGRIIKNFGVILYIIIALLFIPLIQGTSLNQTIRDLSMQFASLIILPISFYHYSKTGNLSQLLKSTYAFILIYIFYVLLATHQQLGGYQSERIAGTTFYFGHVAMRGGITYISFVLLIVPLVIKNLKLLNKIFLLIAVGFILVLFLSVLKRFVFVIIGLGLINYFINYEMKIKYKFQIGIIFAVIFVAVISNRSVIEFVRIRYEERGAIKFAPESIKEDLRIYEPLYVFQAVIKKPVHKILIGEKGQAIYKLEYLDTLIERKIHNTYASLLSRIGFVGLIMYLLIYFNLYRLIHKFYLILRTADRKKIIPYWIAFQNIVLIFLIQGIIGGHDHISLRGLVFLYAGALGGYFNYIYKLEHISKIKSEQERKS